MRLYYIVSEILLIVPIVNFALAAPVPVQEKRQASADMESILWYPGSMFGKRGGIWGEIEEVGEEASAARGSSSSALVPKLALAPDEHGPSSSAPVPSTDEHGLSSSAPVPSTNEHGSSSSAPLTGPLTESGHSLTGTNTQVLSTIRPARFHPDNKFLGANAP